MWQTGLVDFDLVYERFRLPVWRLVRRLTTTEEEALDTTQEIFLRVWRGLPAQDLVESAVDTEPDPERRARATQLLDRIEAALEKLPEHYRVVVWLRDGEDLSYQEIADALDVPIGTVRSRLARARGALKEMVEP